MYILISDFLGLLKAYFKDYILTTLIYVSFIVLKTVKL